MKIVESSSLLFIETIASLWSVTDRQKSSHELLLLLVEGEQESVAGCQSVTNWKVTEQTLMRDSCTGHDMDRKNMSSWKQSKTDSIGRQWTVSRFLCSMRIAAALDKIAN